ncbi:MAG: phage holin family protein [Gemmatimonadetes bacterium]|nr:phage holin family protein [Gemmatimonadota bacterium]MBT7588091.1 phage holin family protein [Gemmatimonadota bacterium]MDE0961495.1 phage holin family protein [Candidatus Latescibacterota bacterium]
MHGARLVYRFLPSHELRTAIAVAAVYGILKFVFYWVLVFISLPFIFVTLGLFLIVINAFLLFVTDKLIEDFEIDGCLTTIIVSVVISLCDMVFRWIFMGI